jgi:hypothetical protein
LATKITHSLALGGIFAAATVAVAVAGKRAGPGAKQTPRPPAAEAAANNCSMLSTGRCLRPDSIRIDVRTKSG